MRVEHDFFPFFVSRDELKESGGYFTRIPWEVKGHTPIMRLCSLLSLFALPLSPREGTLRFALVAQEV